MLLSNGVDWNGIVSLVSDVLAAEFALGRMTTRNLFKLFCVGEKGCKGYILYMAILHESL